MKHKASDLHMHLNGSFSMGFLEKISKRNNCVDLYKELSQVHNNYQAFVNNSPLLSKNQKSDDYVKNNANLIWKQFALIHEIVKTLDDIREGVVDVVLNSTVSYLEIRTSPKKLGDASWSDYADAFVKGLEEANALMGNKKLAYGLLSLDRTIHDENQSIEIINHVVKEKKQGSGLLIGIDISGDPFKARELTKGPLSKVLQYALDQDIGIAIHMGEADSQQEKEDSDIVLQTLKSWHDTQKKESPEINDNPLHGKVRLGHLIHLSEGQRKTINDLQIPVEICPSCHKRLRWWNENEKHPVQTIYSSWKDPIVTGTDDCTIFLCDGKKENKTVLDLFNYRNQKYSAGREHQSKFKFNTVVPLIKSKIINKNN